MTKEIIVSPIVAKAEVLQITNQKEMSGATEILSRLNKELDALTVDREKLTKPINQTLKEIRARYKPAEERYEGAIAIIRKLMSNYQTEQKIIAQEEADKIAARVGEGKGHLKVETAMKKIEVIEQPDEMVSTESGSVKFRTVKKCEVENLSLVPLEYLEANMVLVREAMKKGINLPGIKYWDEEQVINSR